MVFFLKHAPADGSCGVLALLLCSSRNVRAVRFIASASSWCPGPERTCICKGVLPPLASACRNVRDPVLRGAARCAVASSISQSAQLKRLTCDIVCLSRRGARVRVARRPIGHRRREAAIDDSAAPGIVCLANGVRLFLLDCIRFDKEESYRSCYRKRFV